jgi:signal transduction histidine kinase
VCNHVVQFYAEESSLYSRVTAFMRPGLLSGENAVLIATRPHRDAIERLLQQSAPCDGYPGSLIFFDAQETLSTFMVDGWPDSARFMAGIGSLLARVSENGVVPVRAFGEMVALLCEQGNPEAAIRLEHLWNQLAGERGFSLLCAYPMSAFPRAEDAQAFRDICAAHSSISSPEDCESATPEELRRTITLMTQKGNALSGLAAQQELTREEDRKRIAQEVHDELGSLLTGVNASIAVMIERARDAGDEPERELLLAADYVSSALDAVRRVISDLRPSVMDHLGLWTALGWYTDQFAEQTGLACTCTIDAACHATELGPADSMALFRIVQEALTNVARHARASSASILATCENGSVTIEVKDDGQGIEVPRLLDHNLWGIMGMHERARRLGGKLSVTGTSGCGTLVVLSIPV